MSNNDHYERASHTVTDIQYHFVWIIKYRYKVLRGKVALRCRELIKQGCEAYGIQILEGNIVSDHIHLHVKAPATMSPTEIMQKLKGISSRMLQEAQTPNVFHDEGSIPVVAEKYQTGFDLMSRFSIP